MHDLLTDPLIRARLSDEATALLSLPEVYAAMAADRVAAFPALRPHQRHAWHAFLAQLGALALHRANREVPPEEASEWQALLRGLTPEFGDDEPWRLIIEDPAKPAFMQCPDPHGLHDHRKQLAAPDDLDVLVTAKNHDLKQSVATEAALDDWLFALIDLQTMGGYLGAGNYGIARMNGGYSARPCLGLAPAEGGPGVHLLHDIRGLRAGREALLDGYQSYFQPEDGKALLWLEPWDGGASLDLRDLDPYFIEICRRIRLAEEDGGRVIARTAASKAARIEAKAANGNVGDYWTPVNVKDGKALSLSAVGFRYDRLADLVLGEGTFGHPPAMNADPASSRHWRVVARGVAAGQGKTEGYHERSDIVFAPRTASALLGRGRERDALAEIAQALLEEVREVTAALRFGIAVAASGGKSGKKGGELSRANRSHAIPYLRRLDAVADGRFFPALEDRFLAPGETEVKERRRKFAKGMVEAARQLLDEAVETVPCPAIRRHRALAQATSAFYGRLRRSRSVFSDQPEIFGKEEVDDAA